jgi:hypothetical protein
MKAFLLLLFAMTTLSLEAADRRRNAKESKPDTLVAAVNYGRAFYTELNREVTLPHPFNTGQGGDFGGMHSREWSYTVPADRFPAKRLYEIALRAHQQWHVGWTGWGGNSGGLSGGTNRFCAESGTYGASVFIDVIAYTEEGETVIVVLAHGAQ